MNRMNRMEPGHGTSRAQHSPHLRLGNFGRLFPDLPTWAVDCEIQSRQQAVEIFERLGGPKGIMHDATDCSEDSSIPAAYTFFAQFVDHDITLDAESELRSEPLDTEEIDSLPNLRSASLDLDSVYGFGPDISPYLYLTDRSRPGFLGTGSNVQGIENPHDVPRTSDGVALIGDFRNDENLFLSQMHLLFLRLHNRLRIGRSFEQAQQAARYHYQHVVLRDLLRRVCDENVYGFALGQIQQNSELERAERTYPFRLSSLIDDSGRLRMPVEFSGAAYRFGHTMVRSHYPVNREYPSVQIFDERLRTTGFRQPAPDLTVDWRFLLELEEYHPNVCSKKLDHLLANELVALPIPVVPAGSPTNEHSLAFRNLLRGYVFGLPSGQSIAIALSEAGYGDIDTSVDLNFEGIPRWTDLDGELRSKLEKHTPLFFYLMREAAVSGGGERLGPVGSAILMEVFGAMLLHHTTFLTDTELEWHPDPSIARGEDLTLASLVRYVSS